MKISDCYKIVNAMNGDINQIEHFLRLVAIKEKMNYKDLLLCVISYGNYINREVYGYGKENKK